MTVAWFLIAGGSGLAAGLVWHWWRHDPGRKAVRTKTLPRTNGHGGRFRRRRMRRTGPLRPRKGKDYGGHN